MFLSELLQGANAQKELEINDGIILRSREATMRYSSTFLLVQWITNQFHWSSYITCLNKEILLVKISNFNNHSSSAPGLLGL